MIFKLSSLESTVEYKCIAGSPLTELSFFGDGEQTWGLLRHYKL